MKKFLLVLFALAMLASTAQAWSTNATTRLVYNVTPISGVNTTNQTFQINFQGTTGGPFPFFNFSLSGADSPASLTPVFIDQGGTETVLNTSNGACSFFENFNVTTSGVQYASFYANVPNLPAGTNASQIAFELATYQGTTQYNETCAVRDIKVFYTHERSGGAVAQGYNSNQNFANASASTVLAANYSVGAQGNNVTAQTNYYISTSYAPNVNASNTGAGVRFKVEGAWAGVQYLFHDALGGYFYCETIGADLTCSSYDGAAHTVTTPFSNFAYGTYHTVFLYLNTSGLFMFVDGRLNATTASGALSGGGTLAEGINGAFANTPTAYTAFAHISAVKNHVNANGWIGNLWDTTTTYSSTDIRAPAVIYSTSFSSSAFEVTNQSFILYVNGSLLTGVNSVTGFLTWNSTNVSATSVTNTSDQNYTLIFNVVPGVLQVNNSMVTVNFTFRVGFTNGTFGPNQTTTDGTQAIYFGHYFTGFTISPAAQSEGSPVYLNSSIANFTGGLSGYGLAVTGTWNGTTATSTLNVSNYTNGFTAPILGNGTSNITGFMTLNVSYLGAWRSVTSGLNWSVIYFINVTDCSSSSSYIANFTFVNEETLVNMNGTLNIAVELTNAAGTLTRNSNFSFVNVTTAAICVTPAGSYYLTTNQDYYSNYANQTFNQRHYYYRNASVTTTSPTQTNLYLLSASVGNIVQVSLVDSAGLSQADYIIQATRYYPALASYLLVDMGITGQDGLTNLFLRPIDTQHRFFAYTNETLVQAFTPQLISSCSGGVCTMTLTLTGSSLETYLSKGILVAFTCGNSTIAGDTWFTCTYSDPSSSLSVARLRVNWIGLYVNQTACDTTSTSAAGAVTCNLGNTSTKGYYWSFGAGFSPEQTLASGQVDAPQTDQFGSLGILVMIVTVVGIGFMGWRSPEEGIISVAAAILIGQLSGFLYLSTAGLIGILVVAGILAYKGR